MWGIVFFVASHANRRVTVFDTTLRDGEQTPGISFKFEQKLEIARQLSSIGVYAIEAGFPASSAGEMETVKAIADLGLDSVVCGLARSRKEDVDACLDCGVDMVHVFIPTSEVQRVHTIKKSCDEVLEITGEIVSYVRDHCDLCMFSAMDATRTDLDYLVQVFRTAADAGATILNVPDTVGVYTPTAMKGLIQRLAAEIKCPLDVHCHNDFGLAVANTITAVEAGASQVQVTINGLGERAGKLVETSRLISRYSGIAIPPTYPIVGENAFSHESGIHSHGVIACAATFEPGIMTPEMVGHRRKLTLGKHVGRHAVRQMLNEVHLDPSDSQLDRIVEKIKFISVKGKRVTDADLYEIAESEMGVGNGGRLIEMEELAVMTGNHLIPTASVKARIGGKEAIYSATGTGPVDAALKAVLGMLPMKVQLKDFNIEAISGGSDAIGNVTIAVEDEHGRIYDASASGDDIVLASAEAMVNALNILHRLDPSGQKQE
ncbi:MAG: 2-isopropylmalate synthase [Methanoregulaceae archaeon PtaU1.Bin222]|nr:MAG: 2-isopropylmalate synthase [Methanoregulaceae archaeon PtaU1.Bin222]